MFRLSHPLPKKLLVAVSGGVDSMSALHWLNKTQRRVLGVVHINHNTGNFADNAEQLVKYYCNVNGVKLHTYKIDSRPPPKESKENWWRQQRYHVFKQFSPPVVLAHNLDDCVEEYVMCSLVRGYLSTIPYSNGNCIRPFRLWPKSEIYSYASRHKVPFLEDPSNLDNKYKRNFIRNKLLPLAYNLNPGLRKVVTKFILEN